MFDRWKMRRAQNRKQKDFKKKMEVYQVLEEFEKAGEFSLNIPKHQVLIEHSLAMVMMTNADIWQKFLTALYQYAWFKYYDQAYSEWRTREGAMAVVRARKKYAMLTKADVLRIKQARWDEMALDSVKMPSPEPLEFYLVQLDAKKIDGNKDDATVPGGRVTIVGRYNYDSGQCEMATWRQVKELMEKGKE